MTSRTPSTKRDAGDVAERLSVVDPAEVAPDDRPATGSADDGAEPNDAKPVDPEPADVKPAETEPAETEPDGGPVDGALAARSRSIGQALDVGGDRLPEAAVRQARALLAKVGERARLSGRHTVVALAGATGSGKSSLFNAISGLEIATVGARRPTTSVVTACIWGADGAQQLLDWLGVPQRHRVRHESPLDLGDDQLAGLVLLDLPDHDSTELAHRLEVDRMVELVDVFVWVTDPQKYADAALHDRYLEVLSGHEAVTIVVLNQTDRLSPEDVRDCREDLERLAGQDGLAGVRVLTTSATEGTGVDELRVQLSVAVGHRVAWRHRLSADLAASARSLRAGVADGEATIGEAHSGQDGSDDGSAALVGALADAAGVPLVVRGVQDSFVRASIGAAGWPLTRWARRFRPDPLARLRLASSREAASAARRGGHDGSEALADAADLAAVIRTARSSLPGPTPAQRSRVELAGVHIADTAERGLPEPWAAAVRSAAQPPVEDVADALDQAVLAVELPTAGPAWWSFVRGLQLFLVLAAGVGLAWLVLLGAFGALRLPDPPTPTLGVIPLPTAMLIGGLLLGFVIGALVRSTAGRAGRRRAAQTRSRLTEAVAGVAETQILGPVRRVHDAHRRTREALDAAD